MVERLAYWSVVLQIPVYIAQKDIAGGLGWTHLEKGIIYFWWALFQNLSPLVFGVLSDKFGRKKIINISTALALMGFLGMSFSGEFYLFLISAIILGIGLGGIKPALQGGIAKELDSTNSYKGWAIYVMLVNFSVFLAPPLSVYLKQIGWQYVFWGSGFIISFLWILLLFYNEKNESENSIKINFKLALKNFFDPKVIYFILPMIGFTTIYMQFYETLPNFMYDWVDTSSIAASLKLPNYMLMDTPLNKNMISYEWIYNINTGLIILFVLPISIKLRKYNNLFTIFIGVTVVTIGLAMCGLLYLGFWVILGFVVYTFGEMIVNPKFSQYLGDIANENQKSTYLSFANIAWTVGLSGSGYLGGWLYHSFSEKAMLAKRYLVEELKVDENIDLQSAFVVLQNKLNLSPAEATKLLRNEYHPEVIWYIFIFIGLVSALSLLFLKYKFSEEN